MASVIDATIRAVWEGKAHIDAAERDLAELERQARRTGDSLAQMSQQRPLAAVDLSEYRQRMSETADATRQQVRALGELDEAADSSGQSLARQGVNIREFAENALLGAGLLTAAGAAIRRVWQGIEEGAQLELTQRRFDRLAISIGTTGDALRRDLGTATRGMLSEFQAMQLVTQLLGLDLANSADEAVRFARVVTELGMDIGELNQAIANQTTRRFDQLGVSLEGFDERLERLRGTMSDEQAFTMAFLEQAEAQIEKVGGVADTSAGDILRLKAAWEDFQNAINLQLLDDAANLLSTLSGRTGEELRESARVAGEAAEDIDALRVAYERLQERREELIRQDPIAYALINVDDVDAAEATIILSMARISGSLQDFEQNVTKVTGDVDRAWRILFSRMQREGKGEQWDALKQLGATSREAFFEVVQAADEAGKSLEEFLKWVLITGTSGDELDRLVNHLQQMADEQEVFRLKQEASTEAVEEFGRATMTAAERYRELQALMQSDREMTFTTPEDVREGEERARRLTEMPREIAEAFVDLQTDLTAIDERESSRRAQLEERYEEQRTNIVDRYGQQRLEEEERWNLRRARAEQQLQRDIDRIRADSTDRQAELREEANERLAELEEGHLDRMRRITEDARAGLTEAAGQLDAAAIARIRLQQQKAQQEEVRRYESARRDIENTLDKRLQAERAAEEQRIQDMQAHFDERRRLEDEDRRIELERRARAHQAQLDQLDAKHEVELTRLEEQAQAERNEREAQYLEERDQLTDWWDERTDIAGQKMEDILDAEREWYEQRRSLIDGSSGGSAGPSTPAAPVSWDELPSFGPGVPATALAPLSVTFAEGAIVVQAAESPQETAEEVLNGIAALLEQIR